MCKTEYETVYDTVTEEKCETQYETEYTTEFDTQCDTVYEQKCEVGSMYVVFVAKVAKISKHHILGLFERLLAFLQGFFWDLFGQNFANDETLANLGKDEDEAELANATRGIPFNWHSRGMCPAPHCVCTAKVYCAQIRTKTHSTRVAVAVHGCMVERGGVA